MALFEGYERRIDKINGVLNGYGISSIEEAKALNRAAQIAKTMGAFLPFAFLQIFLSSPAVHDGLRPGRSWSGVYD